MTRRFLSVAIIVLGFAAAWAMAADDQRTVHTVTMRAMQFQPASLTVERGDVIVWVNRDMVPHTATSARKGVFDSGVIAAGKSWRMEVTSTGAIDYLCILHPTMKGSLRVAAN